MSGYLDALDDGIKASEPNHLGKRHYIIPCELCGKSVRRTAYSRKRNYICDYCKGVIKKKEKISLEHIKDIKTPREERFDKAVENIKKQVKDFTKYENAIRIAKTRAEKYGSVPEAMVAIELIKNKHRIVPQQRIGKFTVDFAVTDIKTIVEVDGELYHRNNRYPERNSYIQMSLGLGWKIVHIPAELIAADITKLKQALTI